MFYFITASALSVVSSRWPQRLSSESHLLLPSTQDRRVPRNRPAAPIAKTTVSTCPSEHNRCSTSYSKPLPHQQSRVYAKAACISECIVTWTGAGRINQSNRSSSRSRLSSPIVVVDRWGTLVVHLKVLAYTGVSVVSEESASGCFRRLQASFGSWCLQASHMGWNPFWLCRVLVSKCASKKSSSIQLR